MIDLRNIESIEAYYEGTMQEAHKAAFEQILKNDPSFNQEYEDFLALRSGLHSVQMQRTADELRNINLQDMPAEATLSRPEVKSITPFNYKILIGIAATLLILASAFFLLRGPSYDSIGDVTAEYYVEPMSSVVRGDDSSELLSDAVFSFKTEDYTATLLKLDNIETTSLSSKAQVEYWKGHVFYKTGSFAEAALSFQSCTTTQVDGRYSKDAHWMYILSVLNDPNSDADHQALLRQLVEKNEGQYSRLAERLLLSIKGAVL